MNENLFPYSEKVLDFETKSVFKYILLSPKIMKNRKYKCWWCTLSIERDPLGCPIGVSYPNGEKIYSTDGLFCSFNCVKSYINEKEKTDMTYKHSHYLLAQLLCDVRGKMTPVTIQPAPDKSLMTDYGGHMTREQYKNFMNKIFYVKKGVVKMFPVVNIFQKEETNVYL
ncbi:128R [Cherax quadricarinatus iridovirus]|uniref:MYM-type domain-containing protein n=1 Tax=Shrimp hemocyte iridescent virus TaxID=2039780 RepID=A0A291B0L5_9VIRU|nr:128R [Cherax quadricarinatus iridovirus]YP_010084780.1 hypothetical protein KM509_gp028 [Shrimp hemocyte iridescent virus]UPA43276.1 hypothetical protein 4TH000002 [Iridovirus CN01]ASZ85108.1 128R [Cherax quadricarinatus iridovirus]ATE87037.1 hypothetical protein [Shrimp hemocyte iridescent virus]UPA43511.1 hypothetical protein 3TG000078 [Iridovirus CN01]UPA43708.1 hypothetical protein 1DG000116 [Iridovirus CN01]